MIVSRISSLLTLLLAAALLVVRAPAAIVDETTIPLAGTWSFQLDAKDVGTKEKWFARKLEDTVRLPGTTDENRKGILQDEKPTDRLARVWFWKGPAWYQREVTIPASWAGKRITLFLSAPKIPGCGSMKPSAVGMTRLAPRMSSM